MYKRTRQLTKASKAAVFAYSVIPIIVIAGIFGMYHDQILGTSTSLGTTVNNSTTMSTSYAPPYSNFKPNSTIVHTPSIPNNGSMQTVPAQCANFSVAATSTFVQLGGTATFPRADPNSVVGVDITIICNGCDGPQSNIASYTIFPSNTPPQWNGTFGTLGDSSSRHSTTGICDEKFGVSRPTNAAWTVFWSFQKMTQHGTLEIIVSLEYNQTIVFDKSTSDSFGTLSGNLAFGPPTSLPSSPSLSTSTTS